ncbi:MAG: PilZ domain-containing protein [Thiogranum sp.]|jgi:hypothetical protein|nr:PilZ domain-containing protein [Thiogranum sp.]
MNHRLTGVVFTDPAESLALSETFGDCPGKPFSPERLFETLSRIWNGRSRNNPGSALACRSCELDIGADETCVHQVELVDISTTACRVRLPVSSAPPGRVYDIGTLTLAPDEGGSLKLYGTIVRVEADHVWHDYASVLATFNFTALDERCRQILRDFIERYGEVSAGDPAPV